MVLVDSKEVFPFESLPEDVANLVYSFLASSSSNNLFNLMLVNKKMYDIAAPSLYRIVKVNAKTAKKLFEGLNHELDKDGQDEHERPASLAKSPSMLSHHEEEGVKKEGMEKHDEDMEAGGEPAESKHHRGEGKKIQAIKEVTNDHSRKQEEDTRFGLDPLGIHRRKHSLLQGIRSLILEDWEGAKAIAIALGLEKWKAQTEFITPPDEYNRFEIIHAEVDPDDYEGAYDPIHPHVFRGVVCVGFGKDLLCSSNFRPFRGPLNPCWIHPVICALTYGLKPQHICADWSAAPPFEEEEMVNDKSLGIYIEELFSIWNAKSITWHNLLGISNMPQLNWKRIPLVRLFQADCPCPECPKRKISPSHIHEYAARMLEGDAAAPGDCLPPIIITRRPCVMHIEQTELMTNENKHQAPQVSIWIFAAGGAVKFNTRGWLKASLLDKAEADPCICCEEE
ncbi:hypothetical protein IAT40_004304 [Kwoniella sp. CBS 6097]